MNKAKGQRPKAKSKSAQATGKIIRGQSFLIFAFCLLPFALTLVACGKRRPPLPPVERVPQRTELLSGVQRGNQVILSWPAPRRNANDESVQSIRRIDVYRLAEGVRDPLPLTEEEFSARATLIGSVPSEQVLRAADTLSYTDELSLKEPVRLRYAVRYVNAAGQRASFSNFLLIEPAASVSQPPSVNPGPVYQENAIVLRWQAPAANVDDTTPANLLGYNIYRSARSQNQPAQTPLNARPVTANPFDIFPPAPPGKVTAAGSSPPPRVSIFFPTNTEKDLAGYNLYRSEDPNLPKPWTKLNRNLLDRTTFQDEAVQSGKRYFYYVTAVDNAGNESSPSDTASETVP